MPEHPTVPTEYPWWMHHPTLPMVLTHTLEEAQALVDADPLWRLLPYSDEEHAALKPQQEGEGAARPSSRRRS